MTETLVEYVVEGISNILERCKNLLIKTPEDFEKSAEDYALIDNHIKEIKDYWEKPKEDAHQAHKSICDKEKEALKPWTIAKNKIAEERNNYQIKEGHIRLEAQRKAEAEAREKARKEQEVLLARAAAAKTKAKQEELLEKADNIYVEPVFVEPVVEKKIELSFGGSVSSQKDFDVVVTDVKAICKAVVNDKLPIGIIDIKNVALKTFCKLQQIKQGDIDGLQIKLRFRDINRK